MISTTSLLTPYISSMQFLSFRANLKLLVLHLFAVALYAMPPMQEQAQQTPIAIQVMR